MPWLAPARSLTLVFCCLISTLAVGQQAKLEVAAPFTNNMILQRGKVVPVWGFAKPSSNITVTFAEQEKTTKADAAGEWTINLDPLQASRAERTLTVSSDQQESIELKNVLVGEVWFSSGQSNMVWTAGSSMCRDLAQQISSSQEDIPIREISIETVSALYPQKRATSEAGWKTHRDASGFSALSLSFAYQLYKELDVPIGILLSAHSNTRIEAFTQRQAIENHPELSGDEDLMLDADPTTEQAASP